VLRQSLFVLAVGGLVGGCGDTQEDRATSGTLGGAAVGALFGGPVGALIGAGAGYASGSSLDKSADEKIEELANEPKGGASYASADPQSQPSGSPEWSRALTPTQIESRLNEAGYKPVHTIRRQGDNYLVRGEREGTAYDIKVDAATGRLLASNEVGIVRRPARNGDGTPAAIMTEQQVRSTLRRNGYEMVGDVERSGANYRAEAMRNGAVYELVVDGRTGRVVESKPSMPSDTAPPARGG
jgi:hypothetical protein